MKRKDALRLRLGLEQLEGRMLLSSLFVATNGNDSNPGTESQPFRTISHGISVLDPGDTLFVRGGTYAESLTRWKGGTSWSSPVTVEAYPGEKVTVKPPTGATMALDFRGASAAYIVVQDLTIDASNVSLDAVKITSYDSGGAANHIRIANCEVMNAPISGILTTTDYNEFINLNVHNNGTTWHDHVFYIEGSHNLVDHCSVHDNSGCGIHVYNGYAGQSANYNVVSNNQSYNNAAAGGYGYGILLSSGDGNRAFNNVCWGNAGGIQIGCGAATTNSQVYNNTLYNNNRNPGKLTFGIELYTHASGTIVRNNIVYNSSTGGHAGAIYDDIPGGELGLAKDHNLVGINPLFANAAANDFHLQSGSPAIDAGTSSGAPTTDYDGVHRPLGAGFDIGAYER